MKVEKVTAPAATGITRLEEEHLMPAPHLLDYDWRFSARSAKLLVSLAHTYAAGGRICYLGCPTLAYWNRRLFPEDETWDLLDRGHVAIRAWCEQDAFLKQRWQKYDVFDELPPHQANRYAFVIADPPWYQDHYEMFCAQASRLAKGGGLVALTIYPGIHPYAAEKYERLLDAVGRYLGQPEWIASTEVDYAIPQFEHAWGGDAKFYDSNRKAYRPTHMHIYRIVAPITQVPKWPKPQIPLAAVLRVNGDYWRYDRTAFSMPIKVNFSRHQSVERIKSLDKDIVAWNTQNIIALRNSTGRHEVASIGDIVESAGRWRDEQRA
jgi:hypothetical protein